jgi:hypothetical protein
MRFSFLLFILFSNIVLAATTEGDDETKRRAAAILARIGEGLSAEQKEVQKNILSFINEAQSFRECLKKSAEDSEALIAFACKSIEGSIKKETKDFTKERLIEAFSESDDETAHLFLLECLADRLNQSPKRWEDVMNTALCLSVRYMNHEASLKNPELLHPKEDVDKDSKHLLWIIVGKHYRALTLMMSSIMNTAKPFCSPSFQKTFEGLNLTLTQIPRRAQFDKHSGLQIPGWAVPGFLIPLWTFQYFEQPEEASRIIRDNDAETPAGLKVRLITAPLKDGSLDKKQRDREAELVTAINSLKTYVRPNEKGVYIFNLETEKKSSTQKPKGKKGKGSTKKKAAKKSTAHSGAGGAGASAGAGGAGAGAGSASADSTVEEEEAIAVALGTGAPISLEVPEDDRPTDDAAFDLKNWILAAANRQQRENAWRQSLMPDRIESTSRPALKPEHREMLEAFISGNQTTWNTYTWTDIVQAIQGLGGFTPSLNSGDFILNDHRFILHYIHNNGHRIYPAFVRGFLIPALERAGVIRTNEEGFRELSVGED